MAVSFDEGTLGINHEEVLLVGDSSHIRCAEVPKVITPEPMKIKDQGEFFGSVVGTGNIEEVFPSQSVMIKTELQDSSRDGLLPGTLLLCGV